MKINFELNDLNREIIARTARGNPDAMTATLEWISGGLTQVSTQTAFQLARGGRDVFMFYADGTDSMLDDIELEAEYYFEEGKPKEDTETIFLVEGKL